MNDNIFQEKRMELSGKFMENFDEATEEKRPSQAAACDFPLELGWKFRLQFRRESQPRRVKIFGRLVGYGDLCK